MSAVLRAYRAAFGAMNWMCRDDDARRCFLRLRFWQLALAALAAGRMAG